MQSHLMIKRSAFLTIVLLLSCLVPGHAERDLSIDGIYLNGFSSRDIRVQPGERISGSVSVTTSSSSIFRTHTGVWIPSWDKSRGAMRVFMTSAGGAEGAQVSLDLYAPTTPGTHYILFCFDRKNANEMHTEILSRSDEQIYANGRAIRIFVEYSAYNPFTNSASGLSTSNVNFAGAVPLDLDGRQIAGSAGYGAVRESLWRLMTSSSLSSDRDDAVRVRLLGDRPQIDLDMEIVDQYGRRRGLSEKDGSFAEQAVVRVQPGDILYARVYGFKRGEEAPFRIFADRVSVFTSRADPSNGRAVPVSDGFSTTDRAGEDNFNPRWYSISVIREGVIDVELMGSSPGSDIDLWVYDDLGNLRATSREPGSRLERARVEYAEPGTYYVKAAALRRSDESDYRISFSVTGSAISNPSDKYYRKGVDPERPGVEFDLGGVRIRIP
ncbi:MAG: hypothetical protein AAB229_04400 [Candidatus Hydrogenedentota bacterium]